MVTLGLVSVKYPGTPTAISGVGAPKASAAEASARALECVMAVRPSDGARYYLGLVAEMVDTDLRLDRYLDFNEDLSGLSCTSQDPGRGLTRHARAGLVPGTCRIGVNYDRGDSPETARIEIKARLLNRPYTAALPVARGPSGDGSPIPWPASG